MVIHDQQGVILERVALVRNESADVVYSTKLEKHRVLTPIGGCCRCQEIYTESLNIYSMMQANGEANHDSGK